MDKTTVFIYLDACRFDYISKEKTPFLFELSQKGIYKKVRATAGFTQRTPMLTGTYPSTSGHFTWYLYDPANSPFHWIKPFGFTKKIFAHNRYVKRSIRMVSKLLSGAAYPDPGFIPIDLLPNFDLSINKLPLKAELSHLPNIFSVCDKMGLTYLDVMYTFAFIGSKSYERFFNLAEETMKAGKKYDLYLTHLGDLDVLGHTYGAASSEVNETLLEIDQHIQHLCELLAKNYTEYNVLVVSDHGMRNIEKYVDIVTTLAKLKAKVPEDYFYFVDSTIARFWFKNDAAKREVIEKLQEIDEGRIISEEEKAKRHIKFDDNRYGDLLFWLKSGCVFCPSYFQKNIAKGPKGMHGYLDDDLMLGGFIAYSSAKQNKAVPSEVVELVDTFPTLLDLMNIPIVPSDGHSVILKEVKN